MKIIKESNDQLRKFRVQADIDRKGQTIHLEKTYQAKDAVEAKNKMSKFVSRKYGFGTDEFLTTELKEDFENMKDVDATTTQNIVMDKAREDSEKFKKNFDRVAGNAEKLKNARPFLGTKNAPKKQEIVPKAVKESMRKKYSNRLNESSEIGKLMDSIYYYLAAYMGNFAENAREKVAQKYSNYKIEWGSGVPSTETDVALDKFVGAICYDLFANWEGDIEELHEAKNKSTNLRSTSGEDLTFWDKVYSELDGNLSSDNDYKKLREVPGRTKDRYEEISTDGDGNVVVFASERNKFAHAIKVAEHYKLKYNIKTTNGFNDPNKAFQCTVIIPEDKQLEPVTYDVRKRDKEK